ncbi:hypothetical protein SO694_00085012 [Aureococcus anophagefferens]|uniref:Calmodulin n=1 Tax=Aureococcus anophagefferens TaxID=44056 RepID=A0ABR1G4E7_AURAN
MGGISDDSTTLTYGQGSASRTLHLDVQMPGQPPRSAKAGGASQHVAWQPNAFRVSAPKQQRPATSEGRLVRANADGTPSPAKGRPPSAPPGGRAGPSAAGTHASFLEWEAFRRRLPGDPPASARPTSPTVERWTRPPSRRHGAARRAREAGDAFRGRTTKEKHVDFNDELSSLLEPWDVEKHVTDDFLIAARVPRVPSLASVSTDASYHTRIGVVIRKEDVLLSEPRWLDPLVQHMLVAARRDRHVKTTLCGVSRFDLATLNGLKPTSWNPYDLVVVSATNVEKMLDVKGLDVDERDAARARALPDEFGFSKFGVGFVTLSSTGAMYYSPRDVPRTLAAPALTATPGEFVDLEAYEREARGGKRGRHAQLQRLLSRPCEARLYHFVKKLHVFKNYWLWRMFGAWHRVLSRQRFARHRDALCAARLDDGVLVAALARATWELGDLEDAPLHVTRAELAWAASDALERILDKDARDRKREAEAEKLGAAAPATPRAMANPAFAAENASSDESSDGDDSSDESTASSERPDALAALNEAEAPALSPQGSVGSPSASTAEYVDPHVLHRVKFLADQSLAEGVEPAVFVGAQIAVLRRVQRDADATSDRLAAVIKHATATLLAEQKLSLHPRKASPHAAYETAERERSLRQSMRLAGGTGYLAARSTASTVVRASVVGEDLTDDELLAAAAWGGVPTYYTDTARRRTLITKLSRFRRLVEFMFLGAYRVLAIRYARELERWYDDLRLQAETVKKPDDDANDDGEEPEPVFDIHEPIYPPLQVAINVRCMEEDEDASLEDGDYAEHTMELSPSPQALKKLLEVLQNTLLCALATVPTLDRHEQLAYLFAMNCKPPLKEDQEVKEAKRNRDGWVLWIMRKVPGLGDILRSLVVSSEEIMQSMMTTSDDLGTVDRQGKRSSTLMIATARASINLTRGSLKKQHPANVRGTGLDELRSLAAAAAAADGEPARVPRDRRWLGQHWVTVLASDGVYRDARSALMRATSKLRAFVLENLKSNDEMLEAHGVLLAWMRRVGPSLKSAAGLARGEGDYDSIGEEDNPTIVFATDAFVALWPPDEDDARAELYARVAAEHGAKAEVMRRLQYLVNAIQVQGARAGTLRDVTKLNGSVTIAPTSAREAMTATATAAQNLLQGALPSLFAAQCVDLTRRLATANERLMAHASTLDNFFDQLGLLKELSGDWDRLEETYEETASLHKFLKSQGMTSNRNARVKRRTYDQCLRKLSLMNEVGALKNLHVKLVGNEEGLTSLEESKVRFGVRGRREREGGQGVGYRAAKAATCLEDELHAALQDQWSQIDLSLRDCVVHGSKRRNHFRTILRSRCSELHRSIGAILNAADEGILREEASDPAAALAHLRDLTTRHGIARGQAAKLVGYQKLYNSHFHGGTLDRGAFIAESDLGVEAAAPRRTVAGRETARHDPNQGPQPLVVDHFVNLQFAEKRIKLQFTLWSALDALDRAHAAWRAAPVNAEFGEGAPHGLLKEAIAKGERAYEQLLSDTENSAKNRRSWLRQTREHKKEEKYPYSQGIRGGGLAVMRESDEESESESEEESDANESSSMDDDDDDGGGDAGDGDDVDDEGSSVADKSKVSGSTRESASSAASKEAKELSLVGAASNPARFRLGVTIDRSKRELASALPLTDRYFWGAHGMDRWAAVAMHVKPVQDTLDRYGASTQHLSVCDVGARAKLNVGDLLDGGLVKNASKVAAVVYESEIHRALSDLDAAANDAWPEGSHRGVQLATSTAPVLQYSAAEKVSYFQDFAGPRGPLRLGCVKCREAVRAWATKPPPDAPPGVSGKAKARAAATLAAGAARWEAKLDGAEAILDDVLDLVMLASVLRPAFAGGVRAPLSIAQQYHGGYAFLQRGLVEVQRLSRLGVFDDTALGGGGRRGTARSTARSSSSAASALANCRSQLEDARAQLNQWLDEQRSIAPCLLWLGNEELVHACMQWGIFCGQPPASVSSEVNNLIHYQLLPNVRHLSMARPPVKAEAHRATQQFRQSMFEKKDDSDAPKGPRGSTEGPSSPERRRSRATAAVAAPDAVTATSVIGWRSSDATEELHFHDGGFKVTGVLAEDVAKIHHGLKRALLEGVFEALCASSGVSPDDDGGDAEEAAQRLGAALPWPLACAESTFPAASAVLAASAYWTKEVEDALRKSGLTPCGKRERNSQLQRLRSRPFPTRLKPCAKTYREHLIVGGGIAKDIMASCQPDRKGHRRGSAQSLMSVGSLVEKRRREEGEGDSRNRERHRRPSGASVGSHMSGVSMNSDDSKKDEPLACELYELEVKKADALAKNHGHAHVRESKVDSKLWNTLERRVSHRIAVYVVVLNGRPSASRLWLCASGLVAYGVMQRDVLQLMRVYDVGSVDDFEWKFRPKHRWVGSWDLEHRDAELRRRQCSLRCQACNGDVPHALEYESAASRLTLTPLSHRSLLALVGGTRDAWCGGRLMPVRDGLEPNAARRAVEDLAKFYGRRLHVFEATPRATADDLLLVLRRTLEAGAVSELRCFDLLNADVLLTFSTWLGTIKEAILGDQPTRRISQHNFRLSANVSRKLVGEDALAHVGDLLLGPLGGGFSEEKDFFAPGHKAPPVPLLALYATPSPAAASWDDDKVGPFASFKETLRPTLYHEPAPLRMAELLLLKSGLETDGSPVIVKEAQRLLRADQNRDGGKGAAPPAEGMWHYLNRAVRNKIPKAGEASNRRITEIVRNIAALDAPGSPLRGDEESARRGGQARSEDLRDLALKRKPPGEAPPKLAKHKQPQSTSELGADARSRLEAFGAASRTLARATRPRASAASPGRWPRRRRRRSGARGPRSAPRRRAGRRRSRNDRSRQLQVHSRESTLSRVVRPSSGTRRGDDAAAPPSRSPSPSSARASPLGRVKSGRASMAQSGRSSPSGRGFMKLARRAWT